MFSLITFVCDDAVVQPRLPQILVVGGRLVSAAQAATMRASLPAGVHLWREERCWTTAALMLRVLRTLGSATRGAAPGRQVILSADAYRAHMTRAVWRAAAREGFYYMLIPAKMTWALQPCDTHVFAGFKRHLAETAQAAAAAAPDGRCNMAMLLRAVGESLEAVVRRRDWGKAFRDLGLGGSQEAARTPEAGRSLPTLAMLQDVFPRRSHLPIEDIFALFLPPPERPKAARAEPAAARGESPWIGRLRSRSSANLEHPEPRPAACPSTATPTRMSPSATSAAARSAKSQPPLPPPRLPRGRRLLLSPALPAPWSRPPPLGPPCPKAKASSCSISEP